MWQTMLDLFTYPGQTLDRLLSEKNYERSTKTFFFTMLIVCLSTVLSAYLAQSELENLKPYSIAMAAITPIAGLLVLRLLFQILVKLGIRMVANRSYPAEIQERKERSRELYLLYPYHVVPSVIPAAVFPFVFAPAGGDSLHLLTKLVIMIGYILLLLGVLVFQIVIMTMIVQKVYRISTAKAFWGPMLAYSILGFLVGIVAVGLALTFSLINLIP